MNRSGLDIRLDESHYLLQQMMNLTQRGMVNWGCSEYGPIQLIADDETRPGGHIFADTYSHKNQTEPYRSSSAGRPIFFARSLQSDG